MRINCPSCSASFQVADGALGATGRKVRCAKCGHVWHAMPNAEPEPEPEPDFEPDPSFAQEEVEARSPIPEPSEDEWKSALNEEDKTASEEAAFDAQEEPAPEEAVAADDGAESAGVPRPTVGVATIDEKPAGFARKPRPKPKKKQSFDFRKFLPKLNYSPPPMVANGIAVGVLALVLALGFFGRESVVRTFPDFAVLYAGVGMPVNLRGLIFEDVRTYREVDGATPVLVVDGLIRSVDQAGERRVPQIRFSLMSSAGREVYAWSMDPARSSLNPGESFRFKSRLAAPPDAAVDVQVRFVDRRGP